MGAGLHPGSRGRREDGAHSEHSSQEVPSTRGEHGFLTDLVTVRQSLRPKCHSSVNCLISFILQNTVIEPAISNRKQRPSKDTIHASPCLPTHTWPTKQSPRPQVEGVQTAPAPTVTPLPGTSGVPGLATANTFWGRRKGRGDPQVQVLWLGHAPPAGGLSGLPYEYQAGRQRPVPAAYRT